MTEERVPIIFNLEKGKFFYKIFPGAEQEKLIQLRNLKVLLRDFKGTNLIFLKKIRFVPLKSHRAVEDVELKNIFYSARNALKQPFLSVPF